MSNCFITASIMANDGVDLDKVKAELKKLALKTLQEEHCHRFDIRQSLDNERNFILWEEFTNRDALTEHFKFDHTINYMDQKLTTVISAEFTKDLD